MTRLRKHCLRFAFKVCPSDSTRQIDSLSGLVICEYDDVDDPGYWLSVVSQNPHVRAAFLSMSGDGLKIISKVNPVPTVENYHLAWYALSTIFEQIGDVDTTGSRVNQPNALAYADRFYENVDAIPFDWGGVDESEFKQAFPKIRRETEWTSIANLPIEYQDAIRDMEWKPNGWGMTQLPCMFAVHEFDGWGSRANGMGVLKNADNDYTFHCLKCPQSKRYSPKRTRKPIRLKKTDIECVFEVLENTRENLKNAFESGKTYLGLRADTGTGKTEQAKFYYLNGFYGFFSTPTTELAKDVFYRFWDAEINAFRWRGVASEPDGEFPKEKPCIFPDEYIALAESGRNAYKLLCQSCTKITECETDGYRSQEGKAQKAQVIIAPHKDLLMNPVFRQTASRLLPGDEKDLIVVDEFDVVNSFLEINIPLSRLEYLRDTWHDHTLGTSAKMILDACVVQNSPYTGIRDALDSFSETNRYDIVTALACLRIGDTIMDADEAHDYEIRTHQPLNVENIKRRPKLESEDWNFLIQLELFFDTYKHAETAPIEWKANTLTFYLPPLPLHTEARVLLMSATLNETFFRQVFNARQKKRGDVDFIDAADTQWHSEASVFQLRTNRNPRRTLLKGDKDDKGRWYYTTDLTDTGVSFLDRITKSIEAEPDLNHAFIAHKAVIENHTEHLQNAGVVCVHYGNLVGLDTGFKGVNVLHLLGSSEIGQHTIETHAKLLYGMTESPLDFTRNDDGTFSDQNVQAIYDASVKSELMQAIGRARLVINPACVVLWTSHELPTVTHRDQTLLFDESDWDNAKGNLHALPAVIAEREVQEQAEQVAIDSGDVNGVMETKAVGKSRAYELTKGKRHEKRESEKQHVFEFHEQGLSQRAIEKETGISRRKVSKLLDECKAVQNSSGHV